MIHAGVGAAAILFLLWIMPGAIETYSLSFGIQGMMGYYCLLCVTDLRRRRSKGGNARAWDSVSRGAGNVSPPTYLCTSSLVLHCLERRGNTQLSITLSSLTPDHLSIHLIGTKPVCQSASLYIRNPSQTC